MYILVISSTDLPSLHQLGLTHQIQVPLLAVEKVWRLKIRVSVLRRIVHLRCLFYLRLQKVNPL